MRTWHSHGPDCGTVHSFGNGRLCVYGTGPNIFQIVGPPYSSPSFYRLDFESDAPVAGSMSRLPGTAVWRHVLECSDAPIGEITEFVDCRLNVMARRIETSRPMRIVLVPGEQVTVLDYGSRMSPKGASGAALLVAPMGTPLYGQYPFPTSHHHLALWRGACRGSFTTNGAVVIDIEPGITELLLAAGPSYPDCIETAEAALAAQFSDLQTRTEAHWRARLAPLAGVADLLPQHDAMQGVRDRAEDTAIAILTQQAEEGAVLAGYPYHLGYVRDQYGVARGVAAMGFVDETRAILDFYWRIWQRYGYIRNAQGIGVEGVFHVHENDDVEITGYLILQAFDYARLSNDTDYLATITPMLEWAWHAQKQHLIDGMLPFNGDETYVAGGILPRHTLNDGSAEATLLFIESSRRLLPWLAQHRPGASFEQDRDLAAAVEAQFRPNFMRDGLLITNNPKRAQNGNIPKFRHGVCEGGMHFGWTERTATGRYLCPQCFDTVDMPAVEPREYALQSVSLTPFYFNSDILRAEELSPQAEAIVRQYAETGQLPSCSMGGRSVGYDYGLVLYALTKLGHPMAENLFKQTLDIADTVGTWAEYYENHGPTGTRCRPWESAINIEALLEWGRAHSTNIGSNR